MAYPATEVTALPRSHADLLERPISIALTTEMPDGRLQSTVVWFSFDRGDVLVNTMREFQKARNLRDRPRATVLVREPPGERWIELRTSVTLEERGAREHLDALALAYTGVERYFGGAVPLELAAREHPVICRLHPVRICTGPAFFHGGQRDATTTAPPAHEPRGCDEDISIPDSHYDLLERPLLAAVSTRLRPGAQTHPTWFEVDRNDVLINTTLERAKGRNLLRDSRATVLVVDPQNDGRWIEIRGDVELQRAGAEEHLDRLTQRYTQHAHYYGNVYPLEQRGHETRVIARIHPRRINCDAIH